MLIKKKIYEGAVKRDRSDEWRTRTPGTYIDEEVMNSIVEEFSGSKVRITIEVIEEEES